MLQNATVTAFTFSKLLRENHQGGKITRLTPKKWSNTLKQFAYNLPTNFLSMFDHFVGLALKWLRGAPILYHALSQRRFIL